MEIKIISRVSSPDIVEGEFYGTLAKVPNRDGEYPTSVDGQTVVVEMRPPEQQQPTHKNAIALTSEVFIGHLRIPLTGGEPYYGSSRRVIDLSKGGTGGQSLDGNRRLVVSLNKN